MAPGQQNPIRILLVDDHAVVRAGIRMLIECRPGFEVVGDVSKGQDALDILGREHVDIILLDLDLDGENGLDLLPQMRAARRQARVIVLTGVSDSATQRAAVQAGAMGFIHKSQTKDLLLRAIEKVHAGEAWLDRQTIAALIGEMSGATSAVPVDPEEAKIRSLTDREHEVVKLIFEGCSNRQIAQRLSISETTVRHHLSSVFSKLEVASRLELVVYAHRHGVVSKPHPARNNQYTFGRK